MRFADDGDRVDQAVVDQVGALAPTALHPIFFTMGWRSPYPSSSNTGATGTGNFPGAVQLLAPSFITKVPAGSVTYTVPNFGASLHNVSIREQGIDRDIEPGASITVNVTVGTRPVKFSCKYHKSSGMVGALLPGS